MDLGFFGFFPEVYTQAIRQTAREPGIDALMLYPITEYFDRFIPGFDWIGVFSSELAQLRKEFSKPIVTVVPLLEQEDLDFIGKRQAFIQKLRGHQIPVFPTIERAAKVLLRLQRYRRFLDQE